jgi:hypothetical protein
MPAAPPRDLNGNIEPHDHADILDNDYVLRHITPRDLHYDAAKSVTRVASGAYSESSEGGMSVDILRWMAQDGLDECFYLADETVGAAKILVRDLRALGLLVGWDPDSGHCHHGAVWGVRQKVRRKIAHLAVTVRKAEGQT